VAGLDGRVRDVLGDHRLAESLRRDQHHVVGLLEEVELDRGFDGGAIDALRPGPVVVGHGLESAELTATEAALETPASAVLELDARDVVEDLLGAPAALGGERDEVVERLRGVAQAEEAELLSQIGGHGISFLGMHKAS
jgi:hypothetical protein